MGKVFFFFACQSVCFSAHRSFHPPRVIKTEFLFHIVQNNSHRFTTSLSSGFVSDEENKSEEVFMSHIPTRNPDYQLILKLKDIPRGISYKQAKGTRIDRMLWSKPLIAREWARWCGPHRVVAVVWRWCGGDVKDHWMCMCVLTRSDNRALWRPYLEVFQIYGQIELLARQTDGRMKRKTRVQVMWFDSIHGPFIQS